MPLFKKSSLHNSFVIEDAYPPKVKQLAYSISKTLISSPINSDHGLQITLDKPCGSQHYMSNFERPAVLRQHFGIKKGKNEVYCYGNGSGASSVGTHPDCSQTNLNRLIWR